MGRFNVLSENSFSSSNERKNTTRGRNDETNGNNNRRNNREGRVSSNNIYVRPNKINLKPKNYVPKEKDFPTLGTTDIPKKNKLVSLVSTETCESSETNESNWTSAIKQREEEEKELVEIDEHDLKYWRGVDWLGPMMLQYRKSSNNTGICDDSQSPKLQYSRNGSDWYNSWNETFSKEQQMKIQQTKKEEQEREYWCNWNEGIENYCNERKEESNIFYEETGELDGLAIAELERIDYEIYAKQFEIDEDDQIKNMVDTLDYMDDDYLEGDGDY